MSELIKERRRWVLYLSESETLTLQEEARHHPHPQARERCAALLKVAAGHSPHWVAKHGLLIERDPDSLYQWLRYYDEGASRRCSPVGMAEPIGVVFDHREPIQERLRQAPPAGAHSSSVTTRSRWTLQSIRVSFPFLAGYSLAGVWKVLQGCGIRLRMGRQQAYSPDPDYQAKRHRLLSVLAQAGADPNSTVVLFVDQMGYRRWPEPARDWAMAAPAPAPIADRAKSKESQWRLMGALNASTGQVHYLDNYIVGRRQVIELFRQVDRAYPQAQRIYLVLDNWSIHSHPEVLAALQHLPRLELVWLPTYAPWLNPIEKLWRKLRQELLYLHRQAQDWQALQASVRRFLDQFAHGSSDLLRYVGLQGDGLLATALRGP